MRLSAIILVLILLISVGCGSEKPNEKQVLKKDTAGLILTANTSLRIEPFLFSTRIDQLKKGETVLVLDRSKEKSAIAKTKAYWYKIKIKTGYTGWVYGKHLRILTKSGKDNLDDYVSEFWASETKKLKKYLAGKWWSINQFNDFTNHCIEISKDGKYKSYWKGGEKSAIKGDYSFNFNKNEIVFLKGTTFKHNLNFIKMGRVYILRKETKDKTFRFKKIVADLSKRKKQKEDDKKNKERIKKLLKKSGGKKNKK